MTWTDDDDKNLGRVLTTILSAVGRFLMGPAAIIAVLTIVSGDAHINVGAPVVCLMLWFAIWLMWELNRS